MQILEDLMLKDAQAIYTVQQYFDPSIIEGLATSFSKLADPRYTYAVIFPVMFWWAGPKAGGVVLLASALSEWSNIILKWLLQGDRPYWWVGENSDLWNSSQRLTQVSITCETGPGMPSGHVMVSLAVLLCCCHYLGDTGGWRWRGTERRGEAEQGKRGREEKKSGGKGDREGRWREGKVEGRREGLRRTAQCLVLIFSVTIGLTRVLVSTHFFHQVFMGVVFGLLLYTAIARSRSVHHQLLWTTPTSPALLLLLSSLLLVNGLLFYRFLLFLNFDPAFSVSLAYQHCQERSWVHLSSTPFFSLVRSSGAVLGMSLVAKLRPGLVSECSLGMGSRMSALGVVGVGIALLGYVDLGFSLFGSHLLWFYVQELVKSALVPLVTVSPLWCLTVC